MKPPRSQKKYIELKDLNERDFLDLIEAKFQPLFQEIQDNQDGEQEPNQVSNECLQEEEDNFVFFNDLFNITMDDDKEADAKMDEGSDDEIPDQRMDEDK